jgi:Ca-activated chloride channel family protein
MRRVSIVLAAALTVAALPSWAQTTPTAAAATGGSGGKAMIVLDGSGSMWAPVNGRPRIEVAREALGELLKGWDPKVEVGLMSYGHRRKNDCSDIEVLAPAAKVDAAKLGAIAGRISPQGMTPLSAAVKQAAESLKYTEQRATVILISDGIETCKADPCALGAELKKLGVEFRAHVIGFAVQRQDEGGLRCLANATGGKYYTAGDAAQLRDALRSAGQEAAATPKPAPPPPPPAAKPVAKPAPPKVTLTVPKSVVAGDPLQVAWTGSTAKEDVVGFTFPRNETINSNSVDTSQGSPTTLRAPDKPGPYELVYFDHVSGKVVARVAIEVVPAKATLEAVETIPLGGGVEVAWTGPNNPGDFITIVPPAAAKTEHRDYANTAAGTPAKVRVPDRAGTYEIRYVTGQDNEILARRTVVALPVRVELSGPAEAPAGAKVKVAWSGAPNNPGDFITIVKPDAEKGAYGEYFKTQDVDPDAALLTVPPQPGTYELRYVTAQTGETLARRPIAALATKATIEAPATAPAGSRIKVAWTGPNNEGDFVTIVAPNAEKGAYTEYFNTKSTDPNEATLVMSTKPGAYELRYVVGGSNETLAKRPITVSAVQASLEVPATAPAGARIKVRWTGPGNDGDFITVVRPDAERGDYTQYFSPKDTEPDDGKLVLPPRTGDYEIRYVTGGEARILARAPIKTQPFTITLDAPATVRAGKEFDLTWTGPKLPENFITLVKPSDDPETAEQTVNVDAEQELRFPAPSEPGTYELRYVVPQLKRVMAKKTIVVR